MSWTDVHRYYEALHQAEADLDRTDGVLVWRAAYAEVFGTPLRLTQALRSYWTNMVRAQVEWVDEFNWRRIDAADELAAAHPGLVALLVRTDMEDVLVRSHADLAGVA